MNQKRTIGIDIAKKSFYLMILNSQGKPEGKKKLNRKSLLDYLVQQPTSTVSMESCSTSHYWAREMEKLGHQVILLPAQHVKAYLRKQKNDYNDAQAIAEACQHGTIRPVAIKTVEQQDDQTFLQMRRHITGERTNLINHIRGLLAEYGIIVRKGGTELRKALPSILENNNNDLSPQTLLLMHRQYDRLIALDEEMDWYDKQLKKEARKDEVCKRLVKIPGFGPVVSKVIRSWMGDGKQFRRGRDASAALGLVPRQNSTGGRQVLLGISKCGDSYARSQIVHGARAVVTAAIRKNDPLSNWINRLVANRGFNKASVALANKLIRIAWVVISKGESYSVRPPIASV